MTRNVRPRLSARVTHVRHHAVDRPVDGLRCARARTYGMVTNTHRRETPSQHRSGLCAREAGAHAGMAFVGVLA